MPERIQLSRAAGWRMPHGAVKVDRSTKWGNPFRVGDPHPETGEPLKHGTVLNLFRKWLRDTPEGQAIARAAHRELAGKSLACWCGFGGPCHATVLMKIAAKTEKGLDAWLDIGRRKWDRVAKAAVANPDSVAGGAGGEGRSDAAA